MVLSLLGFHPTLAQRLAPPAIPLSDKILHFFAFGLASAEFYACWVVDDQARARVWMWRQFNEGLSGIVCVLFGGIVSEFVQSLLPYKTVSISAFGVDFQLTLVPLVPMGRCHRE